jgi:hypothetical protein
VTAYQTADFRSDRVFGTHRASFSSSHREILTETGRLSPRAAVAFFELLALLAIAERGLADLREKLSTATSITQPGQK